MEQLDVLLKNLCPPANPPSSQPQHQRSRHKIFHDRGVIAQRLGHWNITGCRRPRAKSRRHPSCRHFPCPRSLCVQPGGSTLSSGSTKAVALWNLSCLHLVRAPYSKGAARCYTRTRACPRAQNSPCTSGRHRLPYTVIRPPVLTPWDLPSATGFSCPCTPSRRTVIETSCPQNCTIFAHLP